MICNNGAKFSEIRNSGYIPFTNRIDCANIISSLIQRVLKSNKGG
jgi:hypothetical protein